MINKIKNVFFTCYKILFKIAGILLPKRKGLIIFESFLGKQYSDNPRAIYEYLLSNTSNHEMIWSVSRGSVQTFKQLKIPYVRRFTLKWLFTMNRASYWVTNSRLPLWIPKPSRTIYLQTWHGSPLKRLAADMEEVLMPGTNTEQYKRNFLSETSKWDYLISANAYSTEIFKRAFQFNKTIVESGYPRNDYLINHNNMDEINRIKSTLNIPKDKKVILYAPTWRDNEYYGVGRYKFDIKLDLARMQESLSEEYVIVLRLHYLIAEQIDIEAYKGFVYELSGHTDIRELYLISDMLITDYSSVFFDYANLKRPMIFFVYDLEDYRDKLRGFYFDFEKYAPGPLVKTTEEILNQISIVNEQNSMLSSNFKSFYETYCSLEDGNATKRVVERVFY